MHPFPAVTGIENFTIVGRFYFVKLAKEEKRFYFFYFWSCLLPEVNFYPTCKITSEAINICFFYPIFHSIYHRQTHFLVGVVQFYNVIHSTGFMKTAVCIFQIPIWMCFCPNVIPTGVVGNPINDYLETHFVSFIHQMFKVI